MSAHDEIEKVARLSYGRLVATIAQRTGNVSAASDALGDALLRALETWPRDGVPDRPEAWLTAVARNLAADAKRKARRIESGAEHLLLIEGERADDPEKVSPDHTLSLLFVCGHPAIEPRMRAPLMLQLVLGVDARRMSAAFLIPPGTLGQRLTRARSKIELARPGFGLPAGDDLSERLAHVLDAIYASYSIGHDGEGAGDGKSASLAREAIWLASLVAAQMPQEAEAQALFGLMLYTQARRAARTDDEGCLVPIDEQDVARWDRSMLAEADGALRRAARTPSLGRYQLEAAIAAAHMARRDGGATDWSAIVALYRGLAAVHPTVGGKVGLAAACLKAGNPKDALDILDGCAPALAKSYQPWWAVRGAVLAACGAGAEATAAYGRAMALTADPAARRFLLRQGPAPGA